MIITNKQQLPQSFVEMAKEDYELAPNEYRVTSLLKGIRETMLERRHGKEIEQDVSDMIWLLFGTAVHSILEHQQEGASEFKETRLKIPFSGYMLSGQFDLYNAETETITDYKTCSVWKIIFGEFSDWKRQLLIYAYMLRSIGFEVKQGAIVAMMKDHSKRDAKIKAEYPALPVQTIRFRFTEQDFAETEEFLVDRFNEIKVAETLTDEELPVCTAEERFNSGDKFAVMKKGRKTALRVLDDLQAAEEWKDANGGDFIDIRKGEDKKCVDYCAACEFCNYYREHVKEAKD